MTPVQPERIDWATLGQTAGPIPWDAIESAAQAVAQSPVGDNAVAGSAMTAWEEVVEKWEWFHTDMDQRRSFEGLYVLAIIILAARQSSAPLRRQIGAQLLAWLEQANERDDEADYQNLEYAIRQFGPELLPEILAKVQHFTTENANWFSFLYLLDLVLQTPDEELRRRVGDFGINLLERTVREEVYVHDMFPIASILAQLGRRDAEPLLNQLILRACESQFSLGMGDLEEATGIFQGWSKPYPLSREFANERDWLEKEHRFLRKFYDEVDDKPYTEPEPGSPEALEEQAETEAVDPSASFTYSTEWAWLSRPLQRAADAIYNLGQSHIGHDHKKWTPEDIRRLLLKVLPAKAVGDRAFYEHVAEVAPVVLRWLGQTGQNPEGAQLAELAEGWREEIITAGMDPANWAVSKKFVMDARAQGRPGSQTDDYRISTVLQNMTAAATRAMHTLVESEPQPGDEGVPFIRANPKVGRNDPCPCGSGKKYKKCCGK